VSLRVGVDSVSVEVCHGIVPATVRGVRGRSEGDAIGVARDFQALDIEELRSAQVEWRGDAESAEDLSFVGGAAAAEVFAEDAGMLGGGAGGDHGVLHGGSAVCPGVACAAALLDGVAVAVHWT